jgi:hypothetical protein
MELVSQSVSYTEPLAEVSIRSSLDKHSTVPLVTPLLTCLSYDYLCYYAVCEYSAIKIRNEGKLFTPKSFYIVDKHLNT